MSTSLSPAQTLQARQTQLLADVKALEIRIGKMAQSIARATGAAGTAKAERKANKDTAAAPPAVTAPSNSKAAKHAAKSAAAAAAASSSSIVPAAAAAPLELPSDDDPSRWWESSSYVADTSGVVSRLTGLCELRRIERFRFYRVCGDYYSWPLERRRDTLGLPTVTHLCKSVIMENTRWEEFAPAPAAASALNEHSKLRYVANPRYVLVIVSYAEKLHKEKLARALWEAHVAASAKAEAEAAAAAGAAVAAGGVAEPRAPLPLLSKKAFNLRLAEESVAVALTGFEHNGMTPIGLDEAQAANLPMLMAASLLPLRGGSIALGGGELDVKWRVSIKQFVQAFKPIIADIVS